MVVYAKLLKEWVVWLTRVEVQVRLEDAPCTLTLLTPPLSGYHGNVTVLLSSVAALPWWRNASSLQPADLFWAGRVVPSCCQQVDLFCLLILKGMGVKFFYLRSCGNHKAWPSGGSAVEGTCESQILHPPGKVAYLF